MSKPTIAKQFEQRLISLLDEMREARRGIYGHDNSLYLVYSDGSVITDIALSGRKDTLEGEPPSDDEIVTFTDEEWEELTHGLHDWAF
jgi:hypothetical protein